MNDELELIESSLYVFNPEHDLALANGEVNYMPPASARQMALELALLPMWYAEGPESRVLAPSTSNLDFLRKMQERFQLPVQLMTEPELASETNLNIHPWGWDLALRRRLLSLGVEEGRIPSREQLQALRSYSHRQRAVELLPQLRLNEHFCGESVYMTQPGEWQRFVETHETCLLKAPLSGSGKGLNWCRGVLTSSLSGWCARTAGLQGGVVGEPIYNKVEDFAMEFRSDGCGRVTFAGYSLFRTGGSGTYEGSVLASNEEIERRLSVSVPLEELRLLRSRLKEEVTALFGSVYQGYLGVDMMICRFASAPVYRIHPCVEINLRMNMGVVARLLCDRFLSSGTGGEFQIAYYPSPGQAWVAHQEMEEGFPLKIEEGRILSGYQPLVPVTPQSCYRAWVIGR